MSLSEFGPFSPEVEAPYWICGDKGNKCSNGGIKFEPGKYVLTATPYTDSGEEGQKNTLRFSVSQ